MSATATIFRKLARISWPGWCEPNRKQRQTPQEIGERIAVKRAGRLPEWRELAEEIAAAVEAERS